MVISGGVLIIQVVSPELHLVVTSKRLKHRRYSESKLVVIDVV